MGECEQSKQISYEIGAFIENVAWTLSAWIAEKAIDSIIHCVQPDFSTLKIPSLIAISSSRRCVNFPRKALPSANDMSSCVSPNQSKTKMIERCTNWGIHINSQYVFRRWLPMFWIRGMDSLRRKIMRSYSERIVITCGLATMSMTNFSSPWKISTFLSSQNSDKLRWKARNPLSFNF